jgi:hypothetical protein
MSRTTTICVGTTGFVCNPMCISITIHNNNNLQSVKLNNIRKEMIPEITKITSINIVNGNMEEYRIKRFIENNNNIINERFFS